MKCVTAESKRHLRQLRLSGSQAVQTPPDASMWDSHSDRYRRARNLAVFARTSGYSSRSL